MKVGLLFLICLVQQNAVSGQEFPELLQSAQVQTDELHSFITSILVRFRMEMSSFLTGIVNESLSPIYETLETPQLKNSDNSSEEISSELDIFGKQISRCSAQADNDIQAAIKQFFFVFHPIYDNSFYVLNTVLERISEWNLKSDQADVIEKVFNTLESNRDAFLSTAVPALADELIKFKNVLTLVPSSVSRCLSEPLGN